jgi:RimJ/RimL family protein N-acetyltransferase
VRLRETQVSDCNETYLSWLNDIEVNRFLETRLSPQSIETITEFVRKTNSTQDSYLCAIIHLESGKHIGNIKVGPIHPFYQWADVSYFIGDRSVWGEGCASEAVSLMIRFAFRDLGVRKLKASHMEFNSGSRKVLQNNGFQLEGVLRKEVRVDRSSQWEDVLVYGLLKETLSASL